MAASYTEKDFEEHIEEYLLQTGYLKRISAGYDKRLCLLPDEVIAFIKESQPKMLEKLTVQYGRRTEELLCDRITKEIATKGTLEVLRKGVKDRGCKFNLCFFKPSSGLNPEHLELYQKNCLSVVRQLKYSEKNENSLDMVLFLNGIPIITAELKNSLTGQFVENAIKQYKYDRDPKEPLFQFKRCLVHFAVGNEKVYMATRLSGGKTFFLPFNKGTENPINPVGHQTAYLWEDVWQKETLLDLIKNYLCIQTTKEKSYDKTKGGLIEKEKQTLIFPRYHQFDGVSSLLRAVKEEGCGQHYLIQHSAGSGKSNSIAWLAHQLASLYQKQEDSERLFDSIIVVTDRKVLDKQLQNTIKQFEQVQGVVMPIDVNSAQLMKALEDGKSIIITTLQKFAVISQTLANLSGQKFAVIIDEAHTSQSGESAKHLKETLSVNLEDAEAKDEDDWDLEDEIVREIKTRGRQKHISYFAFTATPKNKTLELFGRKGTDGKPVAFHLYTMRQAIEEGFILDVLKNYTTFKRYFKLAKKVENDEEFEKSKAIRVLTAYVDLQAHAIETKVRLMLDHFQDVTIKQIQGKGRAMIVTKSRLHAVRYFIKLRAIMKEKNLGIKPLVAFSGTVKDPDSGEEYTENGLNGLPSRVSISDAFKTPDYRILVVANKFQTGFDEPLLHTMYVDKKLGGVNAVQTLSRLNRTTGGKNNCVVLDFVNEEDKIKDSFQDYYQTTFLENETDPNKLYELQDSLNNFEIFTDEDVKEFAKIFFDKKQPMEKLQPILDRVRSTWKYRDTEEREDFRGVLQSFIRLYGFISQIISFEDADLEKLYVFSQNLNRKLDKRKNTLPMEVMEAVDLDSFRLQQTFEGDISLEKSDAELSGISSNGGGERQPDEIDVLSNIIQSVNEVHGVNLSEEDKVDLEKIKEKLESDDGLKAVAGADNTRENIRMKFDQVFDGLLLDFVNTKLDLYTKLSEPKANQLFKNAMFDDFYDKQRKVS